MPPDFTNPSITQRIALYVALAALTLSGCFVPFIYVFGLFPPVLLVFLAAAFLIVYLPLLDWPWLAWRLTGRWGVVVLAFCAALIPSALIPLSINAGQEELAAQDKGEKTLLPAAPFPAREILIYADDGFSNAQGCGAYCRALLWSGVKDHVLVTLSFGGDHVDHALLFSLQKMDVCPGAELGREKPKDGLCLAWRDVADPWFDAVLEEWGSYDDIDLTLFAGQGGPKARRGEVRIYDCRKLCERVLLMHPAQATRLAFPAYPVFAFGIDSGGPFGLRYSERPLTVHPPQEVLQIAFGFDTSVGSPRPGFSGDVAQGGPLLPTAKYFRDLETRKMEQADIDEREKLQQLERPLEIYREKLKALRAQHADCASPIISPGHEPQYLGCSNQPSSGSVPAFSMVQSKAAGH